MDVGGHQAIRCHFDKRDERRQFDLLAVRPGI